MPYEESDAYREEYPNTGTFLTPLVPMIVNDSRVCFCKPASLHTGRRTQDNLGGRPTREQGPRGGYRERKGLVWPKHTSSNSLRGPRLLVHLAGGLPIEPASLFSLSCSIRKLIAESRATPFWTQARRSTRTIELAPWQAFRLGEGREPDAIGSEFRKG